MTQLAAHGTDVTDQLGAVQPHVAAAAELIAEAFGLTQMSGYGTRSGPSDHPSGLAIDIPATGATGDAIAAFVTANAAALAVKYVIWQQAIWKPAAPTWAPMAAKSGDRPGYDPNHRRHVHVSFTDTPPEDQPNALDRLRGAVLGVVGGVAGVVGGVGSAVAGLNPLDGWSGQAMTIALKTAGVCAGLALVVIGLNRLVVPAIAGAADKIVEVAT